MNILLTQWRKDREIAHHEFDCFTRHAGWDPAGVKRLDACQVTPNVDMLEGIDALVIGGSGDYLVSQGDVPDRIDGMSKVILEARRRGIPTIGICFGSQIMTKAFGGLVVKDESREEAGTFAIRKTEMAKDCPILGEMPDVFKTQLGHKDHLEHLPFDAIHLASSDRSHHQCWTFSGEPIYAVLWHPELDEPDLEYRVRFYADIYGWDEEKIREILKTVSSTPHAPDTLKNFFEQVVRKGRTL